MPVTLHGAKADCLFSQSRSCMKLIFLYLLLGLIACNHPASQSAYPAIVAGEAIRLAGEHCQQKETDLSWLRRRIDSLENAPYQHQQFVYVLKKGRSTLFAVGSDDLSRLTGPLFDCQGRNHRLDKQVKLTGVIIYTPPAYRHRR